MGLRTCACDLLNDFSGKVHEDQNSEGFSLLPNANVEAELETEPSHMTGLLLQVPKEQVSLEGGKNKLAKGR